MNTEIYLGQNPSCFQVQLVTRYDLSFFSSSMYIVYQYSIDSSRMIGDFLKSSTLTGDFSNLASSFITSGRF